jgi:hypothetical protein
MVNMAQLDPNETPEINQKEISLRKLLEGLSLLVGTGK